jgi:hypothetical protein
VERIQSAVATLLATSPSGHQLCLIGGFRYRLLDNSQRFSVDIDYHWAGNLESKQKTISSLLNRKLLPLSQAQFGFDDFGDVGAGERARIGRLRVVVNSLDLASHVHLVFEPHDGQTNLFSRILLVIVFSHLKHLYCDIILFLIYCF